MFADCACMMGRMASFCIELRCISLYNGLFHAVGVGQDLVSEPQGEMASAEAGENKGCFFLLTKAQPSYAWL